MSSAAPRMLLFVCSGSHYLSSQCIPVHPRARSPWQTAPGRQSRARAAPSRSPARYLSPPFRVRSPRGHPIAAWALVLVADNDFRIERPRRSPFKGSPGLPKFTAIFNTHIQLRYKFRHTVARAAPSSRSREPERRNYRRRHDICECHRQHRDLQA